MMQLSKLHGLGNDFLVLVDLDDRHPIDEAVTRAVCDRHRGVGADGLIRVAPGRDGSDVTMELRNADGSRAEMSGNGIRCLARVVLDAGLVAGSVVTVATDAGVREVSLGPDGHLTVDMGPATVGADGSFGEGRRSLRVDMGNPHLVVEVESPAQMDTAWERLAPPFADYNLELAAPGPGPDEITMRVWERGVGETQACGTGACAAAIAVHHWGTVGERVTVHQPGGAARVEIKPETVLLTGPAELIGTVEIPWL